MDLAQICHVCPCGSRLWTVQVMFEDYEIAAYLLDMECALCGNKAIAPTEVDRPENGETTGF